MNSTLRSSFMLLRLVGLLALAVPAFALINPRFTPTDLVRGASQVWVLRLSLPDADGVEAQFVETLKGAPPATKSLRLELAPDGELAMEDVVGAFGPRKEVPALAVLTAEGGNGPVTGAIQIEALWYSLAEQGGKWLLSRDKADLFSVWAGDASTLAEAARYAINDPAASFPVKSAIEWDTDADLGTLAGPARGCLVANLGDPVGQCAIVLSEGGDRIIAAGGKGAEPADVTAKLKLASHSKRAAVGDVNGDGRMDLIFWDGSNVGACLRQADGAFAPPATYGPLADCRSLEVIAAGEATAVVAGTPAGPVLLTPVGPGMHATPLPGAEAARDLAEGGLCATADVNGDGTTDVLQFFTKGMLFFAGSREGTFAPAVLVKAELPKNPTVAVWGDYDADGRLDVALGGDEGLALVCQTTPGHWETVTYLSGELAYHGNANTPAIVGGSPSDVNNDGRQGVAFFYRDRPTMLFFNRGFACFGLARELSLTGEGDMGMNMNMDMGLGMPGMDAPAEPLKAPAALQNGQQAGAVLDLNGDGTQDLLAVDPNGTVWALFSMGGPDRVLSLTLNLPPAARGPVTVTVAGRKRVSGMYVVRPGVPAVVNRETTGPVTLSWVAPDGTPQTRTLPVTGAQSAVLSVGG